MSFSDTGLGGSDSCSTAHDEESSLNSVSAGTNSVSAGTNSDVPFMEGEGCSSGTAVASSSRDTNVSSQISPQPSDTSLRRGSDSRILDTSQKRRTVNMLSSNYKIASQDVRTFLIEKELLESRCRKLQVEVSTLQTENKLLKERNLKSVVHSSNLESQLSEVTQQLEVMKVRLHQNVTHGSRKHEVAMETELEALKLNNTKLAQENEKLTAELFCVKKTPASGPVCSDVSEIIATHKAETDALKSELTEVKSLLQQSEAQVQTLEEQKRSAEVSLVKLTKLRDFLHQSEGSGHVETAAEKIVKSLEKRLKVTEERFFKERADRGNNLSEVEEKLLTENSKLMVAEKELIRQFQRERDRCRHLEQKAKDFREENISLRLALPLGSNVLTSTRKNSYDLPHSIHSTIRAESKLMSTDVKEIMALVHQETGLSSGEEIEMVCELWRRYEVAGHKLQEWQEHLFDLKISEGDITAGLENLKEMKSQYEEKIRMAEEEVEDILNEKNTMESTYKQQVSDLVKQRHEAQAHLKTLEDLMAGMRAENETLKGKLASEEESLNQTISEYKAKVEELLSEKDELEVKVSQLLRQTKQQKGEIETLETEVKARERSMLDLCRELEGNKQLLSDEEKSARKQIESLDQQVKNLQAEVADWQKKYKSIREDNVNMEEKVKAANQEAVFSKVKATEDRDRKKSVLEHELEERDNELRKLTSQYQEAEAELQDTKHSLLLETQRNADMQNHVESLQRDVKDRQKSAENQSHSEMEQFKQFSSLKEALEGVTQELHRSKASLKRLHVDLSYEKDKTCRLEENLLKVQQQRTQDTSTSAENITPAFSPIYHSTPATTELRLKDLEQERDRLKEDLSQSHSSVESQRDEISDLRNQLRSVTHELTLERGTVSQLTADKSDLDQHLQCCVEERDELYSQKQDSNRDLEKLEQSLHDVITKFDLDTRERYGNFQNSYSHLGLDAQQLIEECLALRVLLEGKDTELNVLNDKISRQRQEIDFCGNRIAMLLEENHCHREDISNQTAQLALKIQEMSATMEVNQLLVSERSQLQMELHQVQTELEKERERHERRNQEVAEILKKFDVSSETQRTSQQEIHKLDNKVVALEADLRHANTTISQLRLDSEQGKAKQERLNDDIRSLTNINTSLEQRLENEKYTVTEAKSETSTLRDEAKELSQKMEYLKHEKSMLMTGLESERKTAENLKTQLETKEEELKQLKLDIEAQRGQLLVSRENYEQMSKEKQSIYTDYQELCKQLNEKDKSLAETQAKFNTSMENIQRDFSVEKASLETDKSASVKEMDALRDEIRELKEKISQKEVQLCTFGRTLQELEEMTKQNQELEEKLQKMVSAAEDNKILINSHRTEIMSLRESLKDIEEKYSKLDTVYKNLEEECRAKRDSHSEQMFEFKQTIAEMKTSHEMEKFELKEKLAKVESQLDTAQSSLKTLQDTYAETVANSQSLESSLRQTQSQLQQTETEKQRISNKLAALEIEFDSNKRNAEEWSNKLRESQSRRIQAEKHLTAETEKASKLTKDFTELQASLYLQESNFKAKEEQVDMLQAELGRVRQMLEAQRQQLASKFKKASFDFKQQSETLEQEKRRLISQTDHLTEDLGEARDQITLKGKENMKLQEELFNMEAQLRDTSSKLRQTQDLLKHEEDIQHRISTRNVELEEELKKVKSFVSKKMEDDGTGEGKMTWNEINRSMQELNMKMDHLNTQKASSNDNKPYAGSDRLRKRLAELETELHTEKALHRITRSSLQASEDDCQRLRRQLRSKQKTSSVDDKSQKSRMEKINEIIAKSQTQAQMMMASGGYYDYGSRDVSLATPRSGGYSPDNSLADHSALLNTSYNNNSHISPVESMHVTSSTPEHK